MAAVLCSRELYIRRHERGNGAGTDLLQNAELIRAAPTLNHFAVMELRDLQPADLYLLSRSLNAH